MKGRLPIEKAAAWTAGEGERWHGGSIAAGSGHVQLFLAQ
jgi:hypothetical protein